LELSNWKGGVFVKISREDFIKNFNLRIELKNPGLSWDYNQNAEVISNYIHAINVLRDIADNYNFFRNLLTSFHVEYTDDNVLEVTAYKILVPKWLWDRAISIHADRYRGSGWLYVNFGESFFEFLSDQTKLYLIISALEYVMSQWEDWQNVLREKLDVPRDLEKYLKKNY